MVFSDIDFDKVILSVETNTIYSVLIGVDHSRFSFFVLVVVVVVVTLFSFTIVGVVLSFGYEDCLDFIIFTLLLRNFRVFNLLA